MVELMICRKDDLLVMNKANKHEAVKVTKIVVEVYLVPNAIPQKTADKDREAEDLEKIKSIPLIRPINKKEYVATST